MWKLWVFMGIGLLILEIFTPAFVVACFGISALITSVFSLWWGLKIQLVSFIVTTIIIFVGLRPMFLTYLDSNKEEAKSYVESLIGKNGVVIEAIDPIEGEGRVKIGGEDWRAVTVNDEKIEEKEKVNILKVRGTRLFVEKIKKGKDD